VSFLGITPQSAASMHTNRQRVQRPLHWLVRRAVFMWPRRIYNTLLSKYGSSTQSSWSALCSTV